ncbi:MAG: hypothetical protein ACYDBB_14705 [Armatimonadota bacterium]
MREERSTVFTFFFVFWLLWVGIGGSWLAYVMSESECSRTALCAIGAISGVFCGTLAFFGFRKKSGIEAVRSFFSPWMILVWVVLLGMLILQQASPRLSALNNHNSRLPFFFFSHMLFLMVAVVLLAWPRGRHAVPKEPTPLP